MIYIKEKKSRKIPGITSLFITFDLNKEVIETIKALPCRIYNPDTYEWEIPLSYLKTIVLKLNNLDNINIEVLKDIESSQDISLHSYKIAPYKYQEEGIKFGLAHKKWLLLDEMGLGKTATAIHIAEELYLSNKIKHCIIVCGVNSLKLNWASEIEKHCNLSYTILGSKYTKNGKMVTGSINDRLDHLQRGINE